MTGTPTRAGRALLDGQTALEALAGLPGGPELGALAQAGADIALVGGAVRDLLLGTVPRELDVTASGDAQQLAGELAGALAGAGGDPPGVTVHERFRTASVAWGAGRIDLAERRSETYARPGALPDVRPGTLEQDIARRDFTVNAIVLPLAGVRRGEPFGTPGALADLASGRMRVLHAGSFRDDPTRLLRLARYSSRLQFEIEADTLALAASAVGEGALASVSGGRVGAELRLAVREPDPPRALGALDRLGVFAALGLGEPFDQELARHALSLLPSDGSREGLLMAVLLLGSAAPAGEQEPDRLLDDLEFSAETRKQALAGARGARALAGGLAVAERPSQLRALLADEPVEAVALAAALSSRSGGRGEARATAWLEHLRHVQLQIDGEDLLRAGVPQGPQIGARLARTLAQKLDGALAAGREEELRAALESQA